MSTTEKPREQLVPRVSRAPGFVTGYWTTKGNTALSMFMFETEEGSEGCVERAEHHTTLVRRSDGPRRDRPASGSSEPTVET